MTRNHDDVTERRTYAMKFIGASNKKMRLTEYPGTSRLSLNFLFSNFAKHRDLPTHRPRFPGSIKTRRKSLADTPHGKHRLPPVRDAKIQNVARCPSTHPNNFERIQ
eukprot:2837251-Rhodomonas_salina.1